MASEVVCGACSLEIEDADVDAAFTYSAMISRPTFGTTSAGPTDGLPVVTVMSVEGCRAVEVLCEARLFVVGSGNVAIWDVEIEVSPDTLIGGPGIAVLERCMEAVEEGEGEEEATHELSDI